MIRCAVAAVFTAIVVGAPPSPDFLAPFSHPRGYVAPKAAGPVVIDGDLSDSAWQAAPWTADFVDIEGEKKPKPRHRTRAKLLWDNEALYIAVEMDEPHVWATLTNHDAVIFHDPDFEVFLDPDSDSHLYAELELNALNTTWDLLLSSPYKDSGHAINGWEAIGLKTAVKVHGTLNDPRDTDRGWTVEIRWPWIGLKELTAKKMPPKVGDLWRLNFSRVEWDVEVTNGTTKKVAGRPEHNWVWAPTGVIDIHRPERWGYLQFGPSAGAAFVPDPLWEARDLLHRGYYSQRVFRAKHGRYADTGELGLPGLAVERTRNGFELTAGGLRIDHEARVR